MGSLTASSRNSTRLVCSRAAERALCAQSVEFGFIEVTLSSTRESVKSRSRRFGDKSCMSLGSFAPRRRLSQTLITQKNRQSQKNSPEHAGAQPGQPGVNRFVKLSKYFPGPKKPRFFERPDT